MSGDISNLDTATLFTRLKEIANELRTTNETLSAELTASVVECESLQTALEASIAEKEMLLGEIGIMREQQATLVLDYEALQTEQAKQKTLQQSLEGFLKNSVTELERSNSLLRVQRAVLGGIAVCLTGVVAYLAIF